MCGAIDELTQMSALNSMYTALLPPLMGPSIAVLHAGAVTTT